MADDDLPEPLDMQIRLTRSEAARYVGASGESTIRAAEANGLQSDQDDRGQVWHLPDVLDAWKWRTKSPSAAQKKRVLREATKARGREIAESERLLALEFERQVAEWDSERARDQAKQEAEDELRKEVRRQNHATQANFEAQHMDETTAGRALEFPSHEARYRLRDLVGRGLLSRFDSPNGVRVEWSWEGARAIETQSPLCRGGPFYLREEVLALRRDAAAIAGGLVGRDPKVACEPVCDDLFTMLVRLVVARAGGTAPPGSL